MYVPTVARTDFMSALGSCLVAWAKLEGMLNLILDEIYEKHNASEIEPEKPRTRFSTKVKTIKKWAKRSDIKNRLFWVESYLNIVTDLGKTRNRFAHGIYTSPEDMKSIANINEATFTGTKPNGETYTEIYTVKRLDQLTLFMLYQGEVWRALLIIVSCEDMTLSNKEMENRFDNLTHHVVTFKASIKYVVKP